MALNLDDVFSKLGQGTEKAAADLENHTQTMDSNKSEDLLKMQSMMQKWTMATQLQSNTLKTIGEGIKSTIANIR